MNNIKLEYLLLEDDFIDYIFFVDEFRKFIEYIGEVKVYYVYLLYCFVIGVGIYWVKFGLEVVFFVIIKDRMNEIYSGKGELICVEIELFEGDFVLSM